MQYDATPEPRLGIERLTEDILDGIGDAFFGLDREWRVVFFNRAAETFFARPREELLGRYIFDLYPENVGTAFEHHYRRVMNERVPLEFEAASTAKPGRWLGVRAFPTCDGIGVAFRDLTEARRREAALRESEARFRHMADSAPALIWMTDEQGAVIFANMHYDYLFGRPASSMLGDGWKSVVRPEDLDRFEAEFQEAFTAKVPFRAEVRVTDRNGQVRWLRCEGVPRLDDAGVFLGFTGCNVDITDARVAGERQRLLINELNHRVKNTLTTVQSIATQTLRNARSPGQARQDFEVRLFALSRAHDVLTRENWQGAHLKEIVEGAVEPYRPQGSGQFRIKGPDLRLAPRMALALAMALHELVTNAVKYGALSTPAGNVDIAWAVVTQGDGQRLVLRWTEAGGPPVQPPTRRGFGSRLIERSLAHDLGGTVAIEFAEKGVICTVDAPVAAG